MNKKVQIGFPMEYEDDKHIIRTGLWLKEYEVEMLEKKLNEYNNLQSKIDKANEILDKLEMQPAYLDCKYYELDGFNELRNALKEDK